MNIIHQEEQDNNGNDQGIWEFEENKKEQPKSTRLVGQYGKISDKVEKLTRKKNLEGLHEEDKETLRTVRRHYNRRQFNCILLKREALKNAGYQCFSSPRISSPHLAVF
jgi:hypothetical protein